MEPTSPVKNSSVSDEVMNGASSSIYKENEETLDPRLDFLSEEFDPVKVLQVSPNEVHLPHPSIHPCDNLQIYLSGEITFFFFLLYHTHTHTHTHSGAGYQ